MNVAKLMYDAHSWISAERAKELAERKASVPGVGRGLLAGQPDFYGLSFLTATPFSTAFAAQNFDVSIA